MPPRKRKAATQPKLEEIVDDDVRVLKSKAGHLDKAEVKPKQEAAASKQGDEDDDQDMFAKRRAKKTGVSSPPSEGAGYSSCRARPWTFRVRDLGQ